MFEDVITIGWLTSMVNLDANTAGVTGEAPTHGGHKARGDS